MTGVSGREKGVVEEYAKSLDMDKNRRGGSEDSKHTSLTQESEIIMTLAETFQAFPSHTLQCRYIVNR